MNSSVIMNFYSSVPAWIRQIQLRFNLHECGCCGLRHGLAVCLAKTYTCFKCGEGSIMRGYAERDVSEPS